jgi:hypothetical protein
VKDYIAPEWEQISSFNGLGGFNGLWELRASWFEPPNERRGGWSGVARVELNLPDGAKETVFLKRQENHTRRTVSNPIFGEPTFSGEIENILLLQQAGVPALEPLYYGQRKVDGKWRAILVTRELAGFQPMDVVTEEWVESGWGKSAVARRRFLSTLAVVLRRMHEQKLVHNSLHPKHVFVRLEKGESPDVALIDLEKMRRALSVKRAMLRDLDSLNRRSYNFSRSDRLRFLKCYLKSDTLNSEARRIWKYLALKKLESEKKSDTNAS